MRVPSVMEKVLLLQLIVTTAAAAAAAALVASPDSDVFSGPSLDSNEVSSNTTGFLTDPENEIVFNLMDSMVERNTNCENNNYYDNLDKSTCPRWANQGYGYCNTGYMTNFMTNSCRKTCNRCGASAGSIIIGDMLLTFSSDELNWYEAKAACASHGSRLAILANENPNDVLDYVTGRYGGAVQLWIGASDITNEGSWLWLDDKPMSNFPWGHNQPDNYGGNEHCLEVNFGGGYNDEPCTVKSRYICESAGCAGVIVGHQCLKFSSEELNWNEAQQACISLGGRLAKPANLNELLDYVIRQYGSGAVQLWIGGSDIINEGSWLWLDGSPMSNFPWGHNQPDNYGGNEHCLEVNFGGFYNDEPCTVKNRYICELVD